MTPGKREIKISNILRSVVIGEGEDEEIKEPDSDEETLVVAAHEVKAQWETYLRQL